VDYSALSPEELVRECLREENEPAWFEFVRRFQPLIAGVTVRTARQFNESCASVIDDLVQETFLKLCKDDARLLRNFRSTHTESIYGFLKVVTANLVLDHFKALNSLKRGRNLTGDESELQGTTSSVTRSMGSADVAERQVLLSQIDSCLREFDQTTCSSRDRRIFWLYYRIGLSANAISSLPGIGLTVKGIESSLLRTVRLIREKLAKVQPPDEISGANQKACGLQNRSKEE